MRWERSHGVYFPSTKPMAPEEIKENIAHIGDFSAQTSYPQSLQDSVKAVTGNLGTTKTVTLKSKL